MRVDL